MSIVAIIKLITTLMPMLSAIFALLKKYQEDKNKREINEKISEIHNATRVSGTRVSLPE